MRILLVAALACGLLTGPAQAQDPDKVLAFNEAWAVYSEAARSGDVASAINAAKDVLDKGKAIFPDTDERIAVLTQNYGAALRAGGQVGEARKQLKDALVRFEDIHGKDSVKLVPILAEYADANAQPFRPQDQVRIYNRALKIMESHYDDKSPEYAALSFRAGKNIYEMSASPFGEKYVKRACNLFDAHFGASDRRAGMCRITLGQTQMSDGYFRQSLPHFEKALAAFNEDTDVDRSYRVRVNSLMVRSLEEIGKEDKATEHLLAIGRDLEHAPPTEYEPVYRVAPEYPENMLARGVQGYVVVQMTVDKDGFVRDATAVDSGPLGEESKKADSYAAFHDPAVRAVRQFRYAPRFENGVPQPTEKVTQRITFQLQRR